MKNKKRFFEEIHKSQSENFWWMDESYERCLGEKVHFSMEQFRESGCKTIEDFVKKLAEYSTFNEDETKVSKTWFNGGYVYVKFYSNAA